MSSQPALFTLLSVVVSAPAVLVGQLLSRGQHTLAVQVTFVELLVVALAAGIARSRLSE